MTDGNTHAIAQHLYERVLEDYMCTADYSAWLLGRNKCLP